MADAPDQQVNFSVDPNVTPLLFVGSYLIGSDESSVTFNFGQPVLDSQQQNIVARVAMTREQAKQFLKNLNDHIEKFEL